MINRAIVFLGLLALAVAENNVPAPQPAADEQSEWNPETQCTQQGLNSIQSWICQGFKAARTYGQHICHSQFRRHKGEYKGVVVFFHGYSACPQQVNKLAPMLLVKGYDVFAPTLPGHGHPYVSEGCDKFPGKKEDCIQNYDVTGVPTSADEYEKWIDTVNSAVRQHAAANKGDVWSTGLSVGGALATLAVSRGNGLYTGVQTFSGFFGITQPGNDHKFLAALAKHKDCYQAAKEVLSKPEATGLVGKFMNQLVEQSKAHSDQSTQCYNYISTMLRLGISEAAQPSGPVGLLLHKDDNFKTMLGNSFGWGAGCEAARNQQAHRGGFCSFRVEHLLAVHALGSRAIDQASKATGLKKARYNLVERDGFQRNGLIAQAIHGIAAKSAVTCAEMYRMTCHDQIFDTNVCGVPHASLSFEDNKNLADGAYWLDDLNNKAVDFITNPASNCASLGEKQWSPSAQNGKDPRTVPFLIDAKSPATSDPQGTLLGKPFRCRLGRCTRKMLSALKAASGSSFVQEDSRVLRPH